MAPEKNAHVVPAVVFAAHVAVSVIGVPVPATILAGLAFKVQLTGGLPPPDGQALNAIVPPLTEDTQRFGPLGQVIVSGATPGALVHESPT